MLPNVIVLTKLMISNSNVTNIVRALMAKYHIGDCYSGSECCYDGSKCHNVCSECCYLGSECQKYVGRECRYVGSEYSNVKLMNL